MSNWLHMPYFWVASGLTLILEISQIPDNGGIEVLFALMIQPVISGLFWGVIATFIAKKIGRLK
uniref:hypothetical protein n=1 Tax=Limnohabitans sp. TaxID=1907725 RepID=UPI00404805BA